MSENPSSTWTRVEIVEIAKWQRYVMWLILAQIAGFLLFVAAAFAGPACRAVIDALGLLLLAGLVAVGVLTICSVYKMAKALRKESTAIVYALLALISWIGLILLLSLSSQATRVLQENGIRVGLMGGNPDDIERVRSEAGLVS